MTDRILNRFSALNKKDRLAHAYLFLGAAESGKTKVAQQIAKLLNCETLSLLDDFLFCDTCPSCKKINSGNHPDIHLLEAPEGETLKIESIRDVISQAKLRPFQAKRKVFIIRSVERMTQEAANALLKTLEEPSASSVLLLTAASSENVLETIQSRCHTVKFYSPSNESLELSLKAEYNDAHFLAWMAQGCLGKAKQLAKRNVFVKKNAYIDQFLLSAHSDDFINKITADKEDLKEFLQIVMAWIRDAIFLKAHSDHRTLIHLDRLDDLEDFAIRFSMDDLGALYRETVKAYKTVMDHLNVKLPLLILKEKLWAS